MEKQSVEMIIKVLRLIESICLRAYLFQGMHNFNTRLRFCWAKRFYQYLNSLLVRSSHHSAQLLIHAAHAAYCGSEKHVQFKMISLYSIVRRITAAHNFVGRKLGESSLFLRMSLHLLTVSKRRKVSPTLNKVAKHRAMSLRVGGPGAPCMWRVSCSTSFCWHPLISLWKPLVKI